MTLGLAIVGYGKMGATIDRLAPEFGCETRARFDVDTNRSAAALTSDSLRGVDVAIEFTSPEAAPSNLLRLASLGIPVVSGTTGWYHHLPAVREAVARGNTSLVWGPNFSVGVNLFLQIVSQAAAQFASHPEYEAWGWEIHHSAKKDAPSGTLLKLGELMRSAGYPRSVDLSSTRAGAHPGTHEIGFDSPSDTITLRHTARGREGFARGALRAALWSPGKKGVFEFREILGELR